MFDAVPADLNTALTALGWSGLPLWAKVISAAWGLGVVAHGNIGTFRNLFNGTWATVRQAIRIGNLLATWLRKPSQRSLRKQEEQARMRRIEETLLRQQELTAALHGMWAGPAGPVIAAEVPADASFGPDNITPRINELRGGTNGGACCCEPNDACNLCGGKALKKNGKRGVA